MSEKDFNYEEMPSEPKAKSKKPKAKSEKSEKKNDLSSHPKFAKFKKGDN